MPEIDYTVNELPSKIVKSAPEPGVERHSRRVCVRKRLGCWKRDNHSSRQRWICGCV